MDTQKQLTSDAKLYIGSAFYPEHWPEVTWKENIRLMQEARFNVTRMADFAWSTLEPEDGKYEFGWLERAIAQLSDAGIDTVLCTPSAAPPAWLISKYPDILPVDEYGRRVQFGNRCHYCVNSPKFHQSTQQLVSRMAQSFGPHPHVIGWQIDNEFNRVCYCERCQKLFQDYLQERYETLDQLNYHWSAAYWSQTYSSWDQIPIPIGEHNPGLMLEFKHFNTLSYKRFLKMQIDELRPYLPAGRWITHNFMNWFKMFDHYQMVEDLDLAAWDWYIGIGHHDYLSSGAAHDLVRGYKRRNFWLIETQPGNVNWAPLNNVLDKGEARAMAWHAVGHGAEAVHYWQFRSALNGQEQYHGTLLDSSGAPRPFYSEAQQLAREFSTTCQLVAGSMIQADVALLNCYDSRWSIEWQPHHKDFNYLQHFLQYYRPLAAQNIAMDIISANEPLAGYKLVIAPALLILNEKRIAHMKEYVESGGHLVLTVRCGMKDEFNALFPERQPAGLHELCGAEVEEYYALKDPVPVLGEDWTGESRIWAERIRILDDKNTQTLAKFGESNGWLDGYPAVTRHSYGKGWVTFVGAILDDTSQKRLVDDVIQVAGVKPVMLTPKGVEACRRVSQAGKEIIFLVNHLRVEQHVYIPWQAIEHLEPRAIKDELILAPYGVAVLTHDESSGSTD